jgi:hypothetical protein
MAAVDPKGNETYWLNGIAFEGVRDQLSLTGSETYWFEGQPEQNMFPLNNLDTSKFFLLFE